MLLHALYIKMHQDIRISDEKKLIVWGSGRGKIPSASIPENKTTQTLYKSIALHCINPSPILLHPRPTQPSIPPGSVNEYQLRVGRQRQVWFIPLANERGVCAYV